MFYRRDLLHYNFYNYFDNDCAFKELQQCCRDWCNQLFRQKNVPTVLIGRHY